MNDCFVSYYVALQIFFVSNEINAQSILICNYAVNYLNLLKFFHIHCFLIKRH
jgi:hypothetical protein